MAEGKVPLIDLSVLGSSKERAAVYAMFIVVALEACVNFTIPLYIQIVQGRTPFDTSLAMMPFNLTVFITATLVVRFYKKYPPRVIGVFGFILTTVALVWLSFVVNNNWETLPTILGLIVFGIGQGALVTLVFNVLVTAAPLSSRATSAPSAERPRTSRRPSEPLWRGRCSSLLGLSIGRAVVEHPELPPTLVAQVDMDNLNFVSNDDLRAALEQTDATPEQIDAAVAVNEESRLGTLRLGLLLLAGLSAVAILPASRLPKYKPDEIPDPSPATATD